MTGIITDVDRAANALHHHGALSRWDYATAGPYLPIDMAGKDAVFLSPHKFIGGPGTPGVLVVKRALLRSLVPSVPGGGTVLFVSPHGHTYDPDPVTREEGGTPAIIESIRAGLVFALKEDIDAEEIRRREQEFAGRALASWSGNPNIEILGNTTAPRLPVISLGLRHPPRLLHSNFVVTLLSDLFGIQARSGCFCAGPYPHRMYRVDGDWSARMETECSRGHLGAKLGFARLSLNYFISEEVFQYIVEAVHLLADHAWKLLPLYRFDPASGLWRHREWVPDARTSLRASLHEPAARFPAAPPDGVLAGQLDDARAIIRAVQAHPPTGPLEDPVVSYEFERIRWSPLPGEAITQLRRRGDIRDRHTLQRSPSSANAHLGGAHVYNRW